jgi:hypothetical protein
MTRPSDTDLINNSFFEKFLESEVFEAKITRYTHHACKDILNMVIKPVLLVALAMLTMIGGLILFIFMTSNNNINRLAEETRELRAIVSAFDERSKNNQNAIRIILEELQHKRD